MKRNQVLFNEGDISRNVYIIKQGQFSMNKIVFKDKHNELKYQQSLFNNSNTSTTRRFNSNF